MEPPEIWYSMLPFGQVGVMYRNGEGCWVYSGPVQRPEVHQACILSGFNDHLRAQEAHARWLLDFCQPARRTIEENGLDGGGEVEESV